MTLPDLGATDALAERLYRGITDKAGRPIVEHARRVAAGLSDPIDRTIALLHEVYEERRASAAELRALGYPDEVLAALDAVSRRPDEPYLAAYIPRCRDHERARRVKVQDLLDNGRSERLPDPAAHTSLREQRYRPAYRMLTGEDLPG